MVVSTSSIFSLRHLSRVCHVHRSRSTPQIGYILEEFLRLINTKFHNYGLPYIIHGGPWVEFIMPIILHGPSELSSSFYLYYSYVLEFRSCLLHRVEYIIIMLSPISIS